MSLVFVFLIYLVIFYPFLSFIYLLVIPFLLNQKRKHKFPVSSYVVFFLFVCFFTVIANVFWKQFIMGEVYRNYDPTYFLLPYFPFGSDRPEFGLGSQYVTTSQTPLMGGSLAPGWTQFGFQVMWLMITAVVYLFSICGCAVWWRISSLKQKIDQKKYLIFLFKISLILLVIGFFPANFFLAMFIYFVLLVWLGKRILQSIRTKHQSNLNTL